MFTLAGSIEYEPPMVPVKVTSAFPSGKIEYDIIAVGKAVMDTPVEVVTDGHPFKAGMVYVIVYVPGVLVDGLICPSTLKDNPEVDENTPEFPDNETDWIVVSDEHHGVPLYEIVAVGKAVIVTVVVAETAGQPPAAGMVSVS